MTFVAADPVASGRPCIVLPSAAGTVNGLNRFIGEATFTIDEGGIESVIRGYGAADATGVRLQEKDVEHSGKDARAWHITEGPPGEFVATPVADYRRDGSV